VTITVGPNDRLEFKTEAAPAAPAEAVETEARPARARR
jgi:hypothetical protein